MRIMTFHPIVFVCVLLLLAGCANTAAPAASTPTIREFSLPPLSSPRDITAGPDGNVWFVEYDGNKIGRITPSGVLTEFPVPTPESGLIDITAGPDGKVWFAEYAVNKVGSITPGGSITEFAVPTPPMRLL